MLTWAIDLNEYLSEIIKNWCETQLEKLGYGYNKVNSGEYFPDGIRVHCQVYLKLRKTLQVHINSHRESILSECKKPIGAWQWVSKSIETEMDEINQVDIHGEG